MRRSSWDFLADIDDRLSSIGQAKLLPLIVGLVHTTHIEAIKAHEVMQAEDARVAKRKKDADRHVAYDAAIILAAGETPLEPTRKMAESLEAVVHANLLIAGYTDKPPGWMTIKRRIEKILDDQKLS